MTGPESNPGLEELVDSTVPRFWVSDLDVRLKWIGRGVRPIGFERAIAECVALGLIEVRSGSESKPGEPGDDKLPISDEKRAQVRQVRRVHLAPHERVRAPKAMTLAEAREKARREAMIHEPRRYTASPTPDPVWSAIGEAQKTLQTLHREREELSQLVARLTERVAELEQMDGRRFGRRRAS